MSTLEYVSKKKWLLHEGGKGKRHLWISKTSVAEGIKIRNCSFMCQLFQEALWALCVAECFHFSKLHLPALIQRKIYKAFIFHLIQLSVSWNTDGQYLQYWLTPQESTVVHREWRARLSFASFVISCPSCCVSPGLALRREKLSAQTCT